MRFRLTVIAIALRATVAIATFVTRLQVIADPGAATL